MKNTDKKRRDFIKGATGFSIVALASGAGIYFAPKLKANTPLLRPPGAVDEEEFLKMCIKCGQCLQVCPYDSIKLEDIDGGASMGMAYIEPNERGCYLCEAFPCILACPTGALDHEKDSIKFIHMGVAVVANLNGCLAIDNKKVPDSAIDRIYDHTKVLSSKERKERKVHISSSDSEKEKLQKKVLEKLEKFRGENCTICADMCPFIPDNSLAITMIKKGDGYMPEIKEACNGCGACAELCPTQVIKIIPRQNYAQVYKKGGNV